MNDRTEERLRAAMRAEVDDVDTDPDAWRDVQRRVRAERSRSSRRRRGAVLAAAAVVTVVLGAAVVLVSTDDDTVVDVTPAATSTTTSTAPTTSVPAEVAFVGVWPFSTQDAVSAYLADPGVGMFFDPEATALEFAREYLGMPEPVAVGGDSTSVVVRPKPDAPMTTTVHLREYDGVYTVFASEADNIRSDEVTVLGDSVHVRGTSTAFEAHVDVEVRDADGRVLGRTFVMGGASGDFAPFAGDVPIETSSTPTGAVVLSTSSAEDGTLQEATVVGVRFELEERTYSVFFHRDEELVEVPRTGPATTGVLRQALEALVAGPTPDERSAGLSSLFSADSADVIAGVSISDGTAVVDLADVLDNASTSAGSEALLAELGATVFQFPTVARVEYRLRGSCEEFWLWLQRDGCRVVARPAG